MGLGIVCVIIFVGVFASIMNQGLWSNTLNLINVILAGLIATNYFEPVAGFLESKIEPSLTYVWDFAAIWLLFIVSMLALRSVTDWLSTVKVRFFMPVEKAGGYLMAAWVGWIVVCFSVMTFHVAPLSRNSFWGAFQPSPEAKMLIVGPDRVWLGWFHRLSKGSLSRATFDPAGDFILRYGNRRDEFDQQLTLTKKTGPATTKK